MSNDSIYLGVLNDTDVLMVPPQNVRVADDEII
jgi:hypothetical protein